MKNYKQILEAINRGIKFALDDFEDDELQGQINSKANQYKGSWSEYLDSFVDLGLPSGTLWCKYNLGANKETDYGDYYAWGELTTKDEYSEENYIFKNNPKQLPPECDIATQMLGKNYSIPTKEQCKELLEYTDNKWIENYNGSFVNGQLFISKINGNSIFIPASGVRRDTKQFDDGSLGSIWTSSLSADLLNHINYAQLLGFDSIKSSAQINTFYRYFGRTIRPVINL